MLAANTQLIFFSPVAANGQNVLRRPINSYDIRKSNAIIILKPRQVVVNTDLIQLIALVVAQCISLVFGLFLFNVTMESNRFAKINIAVKASDLQLTNIVFGLAHVVRNALSSPCVWCAIRNDDVFGRNKYGSLTAKAWVKVDFLKSRASKTQVEQQTLMFRPILWHLLCELVVHVITNSFGSLFLELVDGPNNFCFDRAFGRKSFNNRLRLKSDSRLSQDSWENTASTIPRLCALLILHAKNIKALNVHLSPVFATCHVGFDQLNQLGCNRLKLAVIHMLGQVCIKLYVVILWHEVNLNAINPNYHIVWIFNHDLNGRRVILHNVREIQTHWGWCKGRNHAARCHIWS